MLKFKIEKVNKLNLNKMQHLSNEIEKHKKT